MLSVEAELEGSDSMGCPLREEGFFHLSLRVERAYIANSWAENPPARTRRIIGNVEVLEAQEKRMTVLSNFLLYYARPGGENRIISGQRRDVLAGDAGDFLIHERELILDYANIEMPTLGLLL